MATTTEIIRIKLERAQAERELRQFGRNVRREVGGIERASGGLGRGQQAERMVRTSTLGKFRTGMNLMSSGILGFGLGAAIGNVTRLFAGLETVLAGVQRQFLSLRFPSGGRAGGKFIDDASSKMWGGFGRQVGGQFIETLVAPTIRLAAIGADYQRQLTAGFGFWNQERVDTLNELSQNMYRLAEAMQSGGAADVAEATGSPHTLQAITRFMAPPGAGSEGLLRAADNAAYHNASIAALAKDNLTPAEFRTFSLARGRDTLDVDIYREILADRKKEVRSAKNAITLDSLDYR